MSESILDVPSIVRPLVTIADLLRALPSLAVLVEGADLHQPVRWVHVSELTDPTPYLRGRELLLSAGVHLPRTAADTNAYVARLAKAGAVGLGFGIDPVYRNVPPRLITACQAHGLLLLQVPPTVPFIAISEAHVRELERALLRQATVTASLQHKIVAAATRPDPLQSIVNTLAAHLDTAVLLRDPQQGDYLQSGATQGPATNSDIEAVVAQLLESRSSHPSVAVHEPGLHILAQLLTVSGRSMVLVVASSTQLPPETAGIVNVAATVIALVSGHVSTARLRALGEAVARAAVGGPAECLEAPAADTFGQPLDGRWRVLACSPPRGQDLPSWRDNLTTTLATVLRIDDGQLTLAISPESADPERIARQLTAESCSVGLSDPCAWAALPAAARQARRRQAATTVAHGTGPRRPPARVQDLVDQRAAQAFATERLAPLLGRPDGEAAQLLTTLRTWLQTGGHWDHTAAVLSVHRNTVRNRIAKIGTLLELDLSEPEVRVDLWLALDWCDPTILPESHVSG
ncbi:PucR family transcriptional regulator [Segeticoccus rhizosphaerae]|uniref:PucR family transcriptional regulator n=1 Tax=Segeticoccus rhizosphaerae TaxID=1104777 RepID=UPI0010BFFD54|nr:PucR family transcriptional regulator [Ornithinicoccus soli]